MVQTNQAIGGGVMGEILLLGIIGMVSLAFMRELVR